MQIGFPFARSITVYTHYRGFALPFEGTNKRYIVDHVPCIRIHNRDINHGEHRQNERQDGVAKAQYWSHCNAIRSRIIGTGPFIVN